MSECTFFDAVTDAALMTNLPVTFPDVWTEVKRLCEMTRRRVDGEIQGTPLLFKMIGVLAQIPCDEMMRMIQPFFSSGVNVNAVDANKRNVLHSVCFNWAGFTEDKLTTLVNTLIAQGVDTSHVDYEGNTPLSVAIIKGLRNVHIVSKLASTDAIVNRKNINGHTPLSLAFSFSDHHVVSYLLDQNPSLEDLDPKGNTVLHKLLHSYVQLMKRADGPAIDWSSLWTKYCSFKNHRNSDNCFPIECILQTKPIMLSHSDFVLLLPDRQVINETNRDGESILYLTVKAISSAEFTFIHSVLDRGGNIHEDNLIKAAISSKTDVSTKVHKLVTLGATMTISDVKFVLRQKDDDLSNAERIDIIEHFIYHADGAKDLSQEIPDIAVAMCMFYLSISQVLPLKLLKRLINELNIKFSETNKEGWALMDLLAIYGPDEGQVITLLTSLLRECPEIDIDESQASTASQCAIWEGRFKLAGILLKYFVSVDAFVANRVTVNYFKSRDNPVDYVNLAKLMVASGVPYKSTLNHLNADERKQLTLWMNNRPLLELAVTQLLRTLATRKKITQFLNELEDLPHLKKYLHMDHLDL